MTEYDENNAYEDVLEEDDDYGDQAIEVSGLEETDRIAMQWDVFRKRLESKAHKI